MVTRIRTIRTTHRGRGFSGVGLLVLLLAVAIGLFLYFGSTGGGKSYVQTVVGAKKQSQDVSTGIQAQQLATLIGEYRMSHDGKVPTTYQDLGVMPSSFKDQWGQPLRFRFDSPNPRDAKDFLAISNGPDGKPDTADDISTRVALPF
ncbi:MAG: hypothetical protein JNK58_00685 [Phycisphaerae bacterium]|nr:hypothetical protein [Phycisphaerae bacterium]